MARGIEVLYIYLLCYEHVVIFLEIWVASCIKRSFYKFQNIRRGISFLL